MSTKQKILEWYCREGGNGATPDCDVHCPDARGSNKCFNYKILEGLLDEYSAEVRDMVEQEEAEAREMDDLHNCN